MNEDIILIPNFPFSKKYIDQIISILNYHDPFVILAIDDEAKKYSIFHNAYTKDVLEYNFIAHIDRNIITYAFQFIKSENRTIKQQQLALSCFLYLNLLEAKYELSQPVLELLHSTENANRTKNEIISWNQFIDFLHSDNIKYILDFIFEGINKLPKLSEITDKEKLQIKQLDISDIEPPISWYSAYIHLLKLSIIQKENKGSIESISEYFNWIITEYKSDASCIYFSFIFFSNKHEYKKIYNEKTRIMNLAWDLSHVTNWFRDSIKHINDEKIIDILVTHDGMLKDIANLLSEECKISANAGRKKCKFLELYYSRNDVDRINELYNSYVNNLKSDNRTPKTINDIEQKKGIIADLELELFG